MMFWEVFLLSIVLSIDSFSAAFAMGFRKFSAKRAFSFAFSSATAEGSATAIGFLLGNVAKDLIVNYDHWVAFGLLVAVGSHMCWESYHQDGVEGENSEDDKTHSIAKILYIAIATSLDSLGVGVSLGIAGKPILACTAAITLSAFVSTYLGLFLAKRMPSRFSSRLEMFGGAVLIAVGFKMLSV